MRLHLERDLWWCFACSPTDSDGTPKAGDVIDWVCQVEKVDWRAAIAILDSRRAITNAWAGTPFGRPEPNLAPGQTEIPDLARTPVQRIQSALEHAWMYYTARPLHTQGVRYLARRGIDVDILERHNRRYETGHTPDISNGLVHWMRQQGFADAELVDAGLGHRQVGGHQISDFYRHRILIPVRDPNQMLAGFIGRNIGGSRWPKYKNPPRTLRYDKSIDLYQPLPAPEQQEGRVIVVEGTLDAMAIAVAAIQVGRSDWYCPVTQSGRQLSPQQLRYVLNLHSQPPIIAMDGDQPGLDSNARLYDAAVAVGRETRVVSLPWGEDPASLLRSRGPEGLAHFGRPAFQASGESGSLKAEPRVVRSPTPGRNVMHVDQSDVCQIATTN
jgi:DNA primase